MKRTELKVRNKISEFLFVQVRMRIFDHYEWKGHIGEVWIEASQDVENIIINCYCFKINNKNSNISLEYWMNCFFLIAKTPPRKAESLMSVNEE